MPEPVLAPLSSLNISVMPSHFDEALHTNVTTNGGTESVIEGGDNGQGVEGPGTPPVGE